MPIANPLSIFQGREDPRRSNHCHKSCLSSRPLVPTLPRGNAYGALHESLLSYAPTSAFPRGSVGTRDEDKKAKKKELELHFREFFLRLLQHVPAKIFRIVRNYGLYSNHGNIPEEYFYTEVTEEELEEPEKKLYCGHCKTRKVLVYIYLDTRLRKERTAQEAMKYKKKETA